MTNEPFMIFNNIKSKKLIPHTSYYSDFNFFTSKNIKIYSMIFIFFFVIFSNFAIFTFDNVDLVNKKNVGEVWVVDSDEELFVQIVFFSLK